MSEVTSCPNCGTAVAANSDRCPSCREPVADSLTAGEAGNPELTAEELPDLDQRHGLHRLAPLVFAVVGTGVGIWMAATFGPVLGVALGLLGGGIGVWVLERSRRLR